MEDGAWEKADTMLGVAMKGKGKGVNVADVGTYLAAVAMLKGVEVAPDTR